MYPVRAVSETIGLVAFPTFSRAKHRREQLIDLLLKFVRLNMVVYLAYLGVAIIGSELIFREFYSHANGEDWGAAIPAVRILAVVGLLRTLSFLLPALLDAMGKPGLSLRYSVVASIVLPAAFVLAAKVLGEQLGFLSVAVAWAVGYPIAFCVLLALTLRTIDLRLVEFGRRVVVIPLCAAAALALAEAGCWLLRDAESYARVGVAVGILLASFFWLIARFAGITLSSVRTALRDPAPRVELPERSVGS